MAQGLQSPICNERGVSRTLNDAVNEAESLGAMTERHCACNQIGQGAG